MSKLLSAAAASILFVASARAQQGQSYQDAQAAVAGGYWDQAIAMIHQLLEANSRDLKLINLNGLALTGKGDIQDANRAFEKALEIDPNFYPARKNLALNQAQLGQNHDAERNFDLVLASVPNDPVANMFAGELAFADKDCRRAVEHINHTGSWIEKNPRLHVIRAGCEFQLGDAGSAMRDLQSLSVGELQPEWQFRAGCLLAGHERFAEAVTFFEAVLNRSPRNYDAGFNLALCYMDARRYPEAIATLSGFRERGPRTSELDNVLAEAYEREGKTQEAIDALREATTLAPKDERNYLDLAMLCADHKAFDLGLEVANAGLHHLPNSPSLLIQRGVIYAMSGRFELAEQDFQMAGQSESSKNAAFAALGLAYIQQGDVVHAANTIRERIRQDPDNAALQFLLAESLMRSGVHAGEPEFAQVQAALQQSVRLNPRFVYSRIDLAKTYVQQGKLDEAIQQLKAALEIDSAKVQIYAQLGIALRKQGKIDEASTMFAKVRELNDYNRKHGELAPLMKGEPAQEMSAPGSNK